MYIIPKQYNFCAHNFDFPFPRISLLFLTVHLSFPQTANVVFITIQTLGSFLSPFSLFTRVFVDIVEERMCEAEVKKSASLIVMPI